MNEPNPISYLMLIALVAAVGAFLWSNRPRRTPPTQGELPASVATQKPTPAPEPFLLEIERARSAADAKVKQGSGEIKAKERLAAFAKKNRLDTALTALWDKVKNYPTWMNRDDFSTFNRLNLQGLAGQSKGIDFSRVEFDYGAQRFAVEGHRRMGYDRTFLDIVFYEDGHEVFAVSASEGDADEGERPYSVFDVKAFKKSGNWAQVLLDLDAQLRLEREKTSAELGFSRAGEIKQRFAE